ncbi:DUF1440 domain-containing protein [Aequorivita todarodis]|uniref:DUF1440 domain-containing protein n=1 Tax=Aequorivita todarodis TaxID=2036821 RepID=UPI002350F279|nr:DUF1440 domain-containing protein [Aequorivita todarodis]MDC7999920.1 DUF1440 domain-containing protein [Aequorivita todarodis]
MKKKLPLKRVIATALFVGTLDISAAIINFLAQGGQDITRIFRFIASGVFGQAAFESGSYIIFMGVFFHYLIAFIWTALFFYGYPKLKFQKANPYVVGIVYGLIVWAIMNLIVLPMSGIPELNQKISQKLIAISILIICVGLPISLIYRSKIKTTSVN